MNKRLFWLAIPALIFGAATASYAVTILSVAGSNGSQGQGGVITNNTLSNIYADFATLNAALGGAGTVTVASGKTFTVNNTLTLAGTDATVMTFPTTSATVARTDAANTFTGTQTVGALVATTVNGNTFTTGTGVLTIAAAKTLTASNSLTLAGTDATTITFPGVSVSVIGTSALACGGTTTCANTVATSQRVVTGSGSLSSGTPSTFVLTGISPAFTSSSTYLCNVVDTTTVATSIGVLSAGYVSGSAVTFTGPNTNTDSFRYSCVGN